MIAATTLVSRKTTSWRPSVTTLDGTSIARWRQQHLIAALTRNDYKLTLCQQQRLIVKTTSSKDKQQIAAIPHDGANIT